ncbi:putative carbamate kinase [Shuttleworthella satelles DSM 14600]|uniref:Carbamate kinase n=2 Tax=Shuttleworthella TaxID=177971 RepID=C4GCK1_9FIRM|nr:putative carbamate kinase [Shuttleworthia satelles DSM 14600]
MRNGRYAMKKKRIAIALGHEALGTTLPEQKEATVKTARAIAEFIEKDYQVVITHSNGPQVGMIHAAMNEFSKNHSEYTSTPMSVASAMSQGYIGFDLQNAIRGELNRRGIYKNVVTLLTQMTVDPYDEAFYHPSKVIGRVLNEEEARAQEKKGNHIVAVDGGYRRIVATPRPIDIVEADAINALLEADQLVIACGGGGIPVLEQGQDLKGASAVIEKDTAAGLLAQTVDADMLVILTSVDKVCLHFGTEQEQALDYLSVEDAARYADQGMFGADDMLPKIRAAIEFIGDSAIRKVLITRLKGQEKTIAGQRGTMIGK